MHRSSGASTTTFRRCTRIPNRPLDHLIRSPGRRKLAQCFPSLKYVQVQRGKPLPFGDKQFDIVHSATVVEHVGDREQQRVFLAELCRVSKQTFVTTPNRWYPIELHTMLPLVHYLPPDLHRPVMRRLGFDFFSREEDLNLLDRTALATLVPAGRDYEIREVTHRPVAYRFRSA